jgi:hypothetical protein
LNSNSYKTVTSEPIEITVLEGNAVASSTQNDSKKTVVKNDTFQYIKLTSYLTPINKTPFFGSNLFYGLLAAPFLLLPIIILARKKKVARDADEFGNRVRRNTKLAKKFLADAKKQMGNKVPFYMAMEKALHNFLKAKLHIETSEMSKENIQELLLNKKATEATVGQFISLMNDCEFARYTPSSEVAMQQDYNKAVEVISELEKQII